MIKLSLDYLLRERDCPSHVDILGYNCLWIIALKLSLWLNALDNSPDTNWDVDFSLVLIAWTQDLNAQWTHQTNMACQVEIEVCTATLPVSVRW